MGITIRTMTTATGRSGKPERPSFFPIRAHLLTTTSSQASYHSPRRTRQVSLIPLLLLPPQSRLCGDPFVAVVSLPSVGPCAPHEASAGCFSRWGRQCRSASLPSLSVRLADGLRLVCPFAANRCPYLGQPPPACENLPPAAFPQLWTMLPRTVHFLLPRQKKQNRPLQGAERT